MTKNTLSSHLDDSQCFLLKHNKQNRSEDWMWSEDAEKPPKTQRNKWKVSIYVLCVCLVFCWELIWPTSWHNAWMWNITFTSCYQPHFTSEGGGKERREVGPSPSEILRQKTVFEAKPRCFSNPDRVVFVPKPNQSASRVLTRQKL